MEKKLGIKIECEKLKDLLEFVFVLEKGFEAENFISNKETRKAIKEFQRKHGIENPLKEVLGFAVLEVNEKDKSVCWREFQPFGLEEEIFQGKGIARKLEFEVMNKVKKMIPEIEKIKHDCIISEKQKTQLEKRGINPKEIYLIEHEIEVLKERLK